jgi:hypothetical protein
MLILYAMVERHNWQKYQPVDQFPLIQLVLPTGRPKSTMNLDQSVEISPLRSLSGFEREGLDFDSYKAGLLRPCPAATHSEVQP